MISVSVLSIQVYFLRKLPGHLNEQGMRGLYLGGLVMFPDRILWINEHE